MFTTYATNLDQPTMEQVIYVFVADFLKFCWALILIQGATMSQLEGSATSAVSPTADATSHYLFKNHVSPGLYFTFA